MGGSMTPEQFAVIDALRRKGWAVVVFSPEELAGADRQRFEERLDDLGVELADSMAPDMEPIEC